MGVKAIAQGSVKIARKRRGDSSGGPDAWLSKGTEVKGEKY